MSLVIPSRGPARASIIFLHGLGADGQDLAPLAQALDLPECRWILPDAPIRPVRLNGLRPTRAWFDLAAVASDMEMDQAGLEMSCRSLETWIQAEEKMGIGRQNILVGGFSQGGAVVLAWSRSARTRLGGLIGLSTFHPAPPAGRPGRAQSIFLAHGSEDPIVPLSLGVQTREWLIAAGHEVRWQVYPMAHEVSPEEMMELRAWLVSRLSMETAPAGSGSP